MIIYRPFDGETYRTPLSELSRLSMSTATVSPLPPNNPSQGNLWFDSTKGSLFLYYEDPTTKQWVDCFAGALPSSLVSSGGTHERPDAPSIGDLFLDTDLNTMLYWDGTAWVILGGGTGGGANVYTSFQPPPIDVTATGDLWFNTADGRTYIYLRDAGGSVQWIDASPDSQRFPEWQRDEATHVVKPFHQGDTMVVDNEIQLGNVGTPESYISFAGPRRDTPLIDMHCKVGYTTETAAITIREGNEINYRVMTDGSLMIGGVVPNSPNVSIDANNGSAVFNGTVQAANINIPFGVDETLDVRATIQSLQTLVETLQTRVATLEGN